MFRSLLPRILTALFMALAAAPGRGGESVTVFAAASLRTALDEIVASQGAPVIVSYAGSSALARQIQYGAPADIFISASPEWMDVVETDGLLAAETRADLLSNRLVLIARHDDPVWLDIAPGFDLAGALGDGRLAMALVDAVPAGIYGRKALETLGVWTSVADRTAQADNVRAALQLVALGEAPLGIVYATDAAAEPRVRVVASFDAALHPPIVYPAAILARGDRAAVHAFFGHLTGPSAQAVFRRNGFGIPGAEQ